jgi:glycosyltransferase involved in cell wall biosynthesis
MRIKMAVCITAYEPGGQSVVLEELSKRFAEFYDIDLYCVYSTKQKPPWIKNIYSIKPWLNKYIPFVNRRFIKKIKSENYDVIHCHDSLPFMDAFLNNNIDYFVTCHGNCDWRFRSGLTSKIDGITSLIFYRNAYKKAKKIVAISKYIKEWLVVTYSAKSTVIYNGASFDKFYPANNFNNKNQQELVYFGQNSPRKGIIDLLKAIVKLKIKHPNILLNIGGFGEESFIAKMKCFILKNGLENNVNIIGYVSFSEQLEYYNHCDAVITASFWEGFGLPIVEAYRCNKPIFVRNSTAMKEFVEDGRFRFNNVEEMVERIDYFFAHRSEFDANYENNLDLGVFSWDYAASQYLRLFQQNEKE